MVYTDGVLYVDTDGPLVLVRDVPVRLNPVEFQILTLLVERPGSTIAAETLAEAVWGPGGAAVHTSTLRIHVAELRRKIEYAAEGQPLIQNVQGVGYRYEPPASRDRPTVEETETNNS